MSNDDALRTLEQLRESTVDEAKRDLTVAQLRLTRAEDVMGAAAARLGVSSERLDQALQANAELRGARDYHWAERTERALRLAQAFADERLQTAQATLADARAEVTRAEDAWRTAELARRAASHVLREREAKRMHRAELHAEEEAADSHRARRT